MKKSSFGFDRRVRICGRCHGWFLSEGTHSRFCTTCRGEARRILEPRRASRQADAVSSYSIAEIVGEPVAG